MRHFKLMTRAQARSLTLRDRFERKVDNIVQYRRPTKKKK